MTAVLSVTKHLSAGRGSCLTLEGAVEMDASIMDGRSLDAGSVVCVSNVANPVHLARAVMEQVRLSSISSFCTYSQNMVCKFEMANDPEIYSDVKCKLILT